MKQAFRVEPGVDESSPPAAPRRQRLWLWLVLAAAFLLLLVGAATAALLMAVFQHWPETWQVTLPGQDLLRQMSDALTRVAQALQQFWPWLGSVDWQVQLDELTVGGLTLGLVALVVGGVLAVLMLMTLLPLLVLAVLAGVVVAMLAAVLLAGAVAVLVLLPLWLPAWGIWRWLRRKPVSASAPAAA